MIILLPLDAGPNERQSVCTVLQNLGVEAEESTLGDRIVLVVQGDACPVPKDAIGRIPGVERVVSLDTKTPLVDGTKISGSRAITVGNARFGGGSISVVAGPCTIEDSQILMATAEGVRASGAAALRGGAFKSRTSPHSFQGGGLEAVQTMMATAKEVGLPFFTELTDPRQVSMVGDMVDGVQVGARHMQNVPLLIEVARLGKPILLKRHMAADAEEWLLAAEYILKEGNDQVILCERGVKTSDHHVRYMLDLAVVPWLQERTGLPVIVDPSHAAGNHSLVPALARAAVAVGADGLLVEVHPCPETTRCDAAQALNFEDFATLVEEVECIAELSGRHLVRPELTEEPEKREARTLKPVLGH